MAECSYKDETVSGLVDRIKNGERIAFGELYDRYVKTVYNKCLSFTRDRAEAEDITQDIFIKVYEKLPDFKNRNFGGWLMQITYNQCVDHSRKASRYWFTSDGLDELEYEDSEEDLDKEMMTLRLDALEEILKSLNASDRSLLILKYQEDKKIKDLAQLFGIGESAVKMRLSRLKLQILETYNTSYAGA